MDPGGLPGECQSSLRAEGLKVMGWRVELRESGVCSRHQKKFHRSGSHAETDASRSGKGLRKHE